MGGRGDGQKVGGRGTRKKGSENCMGVRRGKVGGGNVGMGKGEISW